MAVPAVAGRPAERVSGEALAVELQAARLLAVAGFAGLAGEGRGLVEGHAVGVAELIVRRARVRSVLHAAV